ncbi:MAG: response regulator [Cyclobacteriaceae bacterium]
MKALKQILIVENDNFYQELIKNHFQDKNYRVKCFESGEDFFLQDIKGDLVVLNYKLAGDINGLDVLERLKDEGNTAPVIFLSDQEDIEIAIDSLKWGAFDYVIKDENVFDNIDQAISRFIVFSEKQAQKRKNIFDFFKKRA